MDSRVNFKELKSRHKRKKKGWGDKRTENSDKINFITFVTYP